MCCSPWGLKESNTTEQLDRTELNFEVKITSKDLSHSSFLHMEVFPEGANQSKNMKTTPHSCVGLGSGCEVCLEDSAPFP